MELEKLLKFIELAIEVDSENISLNKNAINFKALHNEVICAIFFLKKYLEILDKKLLGEENG